MELIAHFKEFKKNGVTLRHEFLDLITETEIEDAMLDDADVYLVTADLTTFKLIPVNSRLIERIKKRAVEGVTDEKEKAAE